MSTTKMTSYKNWHIPLWCDTVTLRYAYSSMQSVSITDFRVPLIVQLAENPKYKFMGRSLFHGAVSLRSHDFIHVLLGRGMLPKDEAFVIGFTMGSSGKLTSIETYLFKFISSKLYPSRYKLDNDALVVFLRAIEIATSMGVQPLDSINYERFLDVDLRIIRDEMGICVNSLLECYKWEATLFPDSRESQRLLCEQIPNN